MRRRRLARLALALAVAAAAPLAGCLSNDAPFQSSSAPRRPSVSAAAAAPAATPAAPAPAPAPKAPRKPRAAPAPAPAPVAARPEAVNHPPAKDVPQYSFSHPQLQATPAPAPPAPAAPAPAAPALTAPATVTPATPPPAPAPAAAPPASAAAPEAKDTCGVSALADLVGKPRTELPIAQDLSRRRVVCEGCPMTDDVRPDRQTITYSLGTGKVTKVACG